MGCGISKQNPRGQEYIVKRKQSEKLDVQQNVKAQNSQQSRSRKNSQVGRKQSDQVILKQGTKGTGDSNQINLFQSQQVEQDDDSIDALCPQRESLGDIDDPKMQGIDKKAGKLRLGDLAIHTDSQSNINLNHYNQGFNSNFSFFPVANQMSSKPINSSEVDIKSSMTAHFQKGFDTANDLSKYDSKMTNRVPGLDLNMQAFARLDQANGKNSIRKLSQYGSDNSHKQLGSSGLYQHESLKKHQEQDIDEEPSIDGLINEDNQIKGSPIAEEKYNPIRINDCFHKNFFLNHYMKSC